MNNPEFSDNSSEESFEIIGFSDEEIKQDKQDEIKRNNDLPINQIENMVIKDTSSEADTGASQVEKRPDCQELFPKFTTGVAQPSSSPTDISQSGAIASNTPSVEADQNPAPTRPETASHHRKKSKNSRRKSKSKNRREVEQTNSPTIRQSREPVTVSKEILSSSLTQPDGVHDTQPASSNNNKTSIPENPRKQASVPSCKDKNSKPEDVQESITTSAARSSEKEQKSSFVTPYDEREPFDYRSSQIPFDELKKLIDPRPVVGPSQTTLGQPAASVVITGNYGSKTNLGDMLTAYDEPYVNKYVMSSDELSQLIAPKPLPESFDQSKRPL